MAEAISFGLGATAALLAHKILGPTADYLGGELKESIAKRRMKNFESILSNAKDKLGDRIEKTGQVPPKVLKAILNDGSYCEDKLSVEYFGGVLASSKTDTGRDDRGARLAKQVDSLSTYQLRSHYLIYSAVSVLFRDGTHSFNLPEDREKMRLYIPMENYVRTMGFTQGELTPQILGHVFHGLSKEGLIEGTWGFGGTEVLRKMYSKAPGVGILCTPSALGAELFLWAFGHGDKPLNFLLAGGVAAEIEGIPQLGSQVVATGTG